MVCAFLKYHSMRDSAFRTVAMHNAPPALAEMRRRNPVFRPNPELRSHAQRRRNRRFKSFDIPAKNRAICDGHHSEGRA
jgi:hypothetical protein